MDNKNVLCYVYYNQIVWKLAYFNIFVVGALQICMIHIYQKKHS